MSERHFETDAVHAGLNVEPTTGAINVPIYASSTFVQDAPGEHKGYEYSRTANPTRDALETALAELEGCGPGGEAMAAASGLAATSLIGYLLKPGDHVVIPHDAYGGTYRFFVQVLGEHGVSATTVDFTDANAVAAAVTPNTRLLWVETPTNPFLHIVDLEAVAGIAAELSALLAVDNTFATPYLQRPLSLGADLAIHSTTKYLGGHSDVIGGAVIANDPELVERLRFVQNAAGPAASPFDSFLVLRGLRTLALRMDRHCSNAAVVADFLADHPSVAQVYYPGRLDHPGHAIAERQMSASGGMVSFRHAHGAEAAQKTASATELFLLAESLGGVESLIEVPATMTHVSVAGTALEVPDDLVRLSVGIEHIDDLLVDLERALA